MGKSSRTWRKMTRQAKLSSPFSSGGGGFHFEAHVQASFVALMLTNGYAPCLPCWPIAEIKLQGRIAGFETDDLIVVAENANTEERRKLLGQIKHSISITRRNAQFGEVIGAAWRDFTNPAVFTQNKDVIALITGPLSATDTRNVQWLLNQARRTTDAGEFFRNVHQANFSPAKSKTKLAAIQHHLRIANNHNEVPRDQLYDFLNHFHLLGYDLGGESGVVLSLLHSHISQLHQKHPRWLWSRVVDIVQTWNQDAGTITRTKLPEDILNAFRQEPVSKMPEELKEGPERHATNWNEHPAATHLALAVLIGSWRDDNQNDVDWTAQLLDISYEEWLRKGRELLHHPGRALTLSNGTWEVQDRTKLWGLLGARILDQDINRFRLIAVSILREPDPALDLPSEQRYTAAIRGKTLKHSRALRRGVAEGLAILGSRPEACNNCSQGKAESICALAVREILTDANWVLWGSLSDVLPTLAEAAPGEFLDAVEHAIRLQPCPFDELLSQRGAGITGGNCAIGLFWALEVLAWDEQYLVRVCVALGELASREPDEHARNLALDSLVTILLPWLPQTLAPAEKRTVALSTMLAECAGVAWSLIIRLLPGQHQVSSGSQKPKWRNMIPGDWKDGVSQQEYWQQTSSYAELALSAAGKDPARLSTLIDHLDHLSDPMIDRLLRLLSSEAILELPEAQRLSIWTHLDAIIRRHRRFSDAKWALPTELTNRIEQVAVRLAPVDPRIKYQPLFTDRDFELFEENGDWDEQQEKLDQRRTTATSEILHQHGAKGVVRFAEATSAPAQVGRALGVVAEQDIDQRLIPYLLDSAHDKHRAFVGGFIWGRYHHLGWTWCDDLDRSEWTAEHAGRFLACLPFSKGTWDRASAWIPSQEREYWSRAGVNAYQAEGDLTIAVERLIECGRPHAAIGCLDRMRREQQPVDRGQCVRALLGALSSSEPRSAMDRYRIIHLIELLQSDIAVDRDDLLKIEWAYIPLLDGERGATPRFLESRLATDPEFFCEVLRLIYRSRGEEEPTTEPTEEARAIATNAWRLLHGWKTPPGTEADGGFSERNFTEWLHRVRGICTKSGHIEVALMKIGEVLIHAPSDPDGLWLHRSVAAELNGRESREMRGGFRVATYNSRGVHRVDPSGKAERDLATQWRIKAETIENAGYQRFAATLRELADGYDCEADRIVDDHRGR